MAKIACYVLFGDLAGYYSLIPAILATSFEAKALIDKLALLGFSKVFWIPQVVDSISCAVHLQITTYRVGMAARHGGGRVTLGQGLDREVHLLGTSCDI